MAKLELRDISRTFARQIVAVRRLNLAVDDGQLVVLVGPSGSGKTTTLRLIAGLERPTEGQVWIAGQDVTRWAPSRRRVAMTFQRAALYPHLTVRENLTFGTRRTQHTTIRQSLDVVVKMLDIGHLLDRRPQTLSGGEQQRVALGKAIVRQPAAFLLDEPFSGLDAPRRIALQTELRSLLCQQRSATIYVTHDQKEALVMADRLVVLDRGTIRQEGTPEQIYSQPDNLFVARFFGELPINTLAGQYQIAAQQARLTGPNWSFVLPKCAGLPPDLATGRRVTLAIRPEHVRLTAIWSTTENSGWVRSCRPWSDRWMVHVVVTDNETNNGGIELTVLAPKQSPNSKVGVAINWTCVHWFDTKSGHRLEPKNRTTS